jgi:hypothetical protein
MRYTELLLEYDRARALAALSTKFRDAVVKDYVGYYGNNWNTLPRVAELLADPRLPGLVDRAMERIEQADPTPNKKYTQWMARQFASGHPGVNKIEDIESTLSDYVHKFHTLNQRRKLASPFNDINRYKDVYDFMHAMDQHELESPEDDNQGQADRVYEDGDVKVVVPRDQTAACRYGRQTRWCTAATHGTNYFEHYNTQGPLYILIPRKPMYAGEKYQLHFPSGQYMNEDDEPVSLANLTKRFPSLFEWFRNSNDTVIQDRLNHSVTLMHDSDLQSISDEIWRVVYDHFLMPELTQAEAQDHSYYDWLRDQGFVDDDDNVDWERAPPYTEWNSSWADIIENTEKLVHLKPTEMRYVVHTQQEQDMSSSDDIMNWEVTLGHWIEDQAYKYSNRYFFDTKLSQFLKRKVVIQRQGDNIVVDVFAG